MLCQKKKLYIRTQPDDYGVMTLMTSHFQEAPLQQDGDDPDPDPPDDDDGDDPDEANWQLFEGQTNDELPTAGNIMAWRPIREGFEARGRPESQLIHLDEVDSDMRADFLDEAIMRTWPDLPALQWLRVMVHDSFDRCPGTNRQRHHFVVVDEEQFTLGSPWKGGILAIELLESENQPPTWDIHAWVSPEPMTYESILRQIDIPASDFQITISLNGVILHPGGPDRYVYHGFFVEVQLASLEIDLGQQILDQLLLTPSGGYPSRSPTPSRGVSRENIESEVLSQDSVPTLSSQDSRGPGSYEGNDEPLAPDDDADEPTRPSTESGHPDIEDILSGPDIFEVSHFDFDSAQTSLPESHVDAPVVSGLVQPVTISLADAIPVVCSEPANQAIAPSHGNEVSGPNSPPKNDDIRFKRRINLSLLIPEVVATADANSTCIAAASDAFSIPDAQLFFQFTTPWSFELFDIIPDRITLHDATADCFRTRPPLPDFCGQVLHYFTDGSAHADQNTAGWAWAAFIGHDKDTPIQDLQLLGWLAGPVVVDPGHPHHIGASKFSSLEGEASAMFWALVHSLSSASWCHAIVVHFDALHVGNVMHGVYKTNPDYPILEALRLMMHAVENLYKPEQVHCRHVKGHTSHPLNELVNTLAAHASYDSSWTSQPTELDFTALFAEDRHALKWLWLHPRRLHHAAALPQVQGSQMVFPNRSQLIATDSNLDWTFWVWST